MLLLLPRQVSVFADDQCPRYRGSRRDLYYYSEQQTRAELGLCPASSAPASLLAAVEPPTTTIPLHLVDFLFLVEYSDTVNGSYLDHLTTTIKNLSLMHSETGLYADPTFTILIYSSEEDSPVVLYFKHFHYIPSGYDLREEINNFAYHQSSRTANLSSREMGYRVVDGALQMLSKVLSGDSITDTTGLSHSLAFRPQSSVHIVLGVFERTGNVSVPATTYNSTAVTALRTSIEKHLNLILDHLLTHTTLHFVLTSGVVSATEFIGSSRHEVRYRDCTHLNKALTLQALLEASGQSGSLQAHLLALGREIHIMDFSLLKRVDCVRAISPVLWGGYEYPLINRCSGEECSYTGHYCSPLHGCVSDSSSTVTTDDRVPLTGQLVMSHADLAKSAVSSSTDSSSAGDTEELSISKSIHTSSPAFSLSDVVYGRPRTLTVTPEREFVERIIISGKAVVIKNSVVSSWAALKKWDFPYLANNMGTDTLTQVKCSDNYLTFDPDRTAPLKLSIALPFTERNMSTSSFFSCIQEPSSCPDGRLGHYYFGSVPASLQADLDPTRLLYWTDRDHRAGRQFLWISSAGMITHAHFDQDHNFFVQLKGEKRFTLWSSSQHELLYMYPRVHPLWHKSRINFRAADLTKFPDFARSRAQQVVLGPGDVLYVPPYTWHYVETLSPSVSLSTWSHDYDLYDHMNAIYRHDHKFDLIKDPRGVLCLAHVKRFCTFILSMC